MSLKQMMFAALLCVFAKPLAAQPPVVEDLFEVKGKLEATDPVDEARMKPGKVHEVKLLKGKKYQIDLISGDFDAYLRLVDASGQQVDQNDDGGEGTNARIKFTPKQDQVFKIHVTTFAGGVGNYYLRVVGPGGGVKGNVVLKVDGTLKSTDPRDAKRTSSPSQLHEVTFKQGMTYQIDMMSSEFDSYLRLENPEGKEVAKDDDSGGDRNARIRFTAGEAGVYKISTTCFGFKTGAYTLVVRELDNKAIPLPAPTAATPVKIDGKLEPSDDVDPASKSRPSKAYTVRMIKGKTYVIDLRSDSFDTYLRLEGPKGEKLAADDDSGGDLNARIVFACRTDGVYRIIATSFDDRLGAYTLEVAEK